MFNRRFFAKADTFGDRVALIWTNKRDKKIKWSFKKKNKKSSNLLSVFSVYCICYLFIFSKRRKRNTYLIQRERQIMIKPVNLNRYLNRERRYERGRERERTSPFLVMHKTSCNSLQNQLAWLGRLKCYHAFNNYRTISGLPPSPALFSYMPNVNTCVYQIVQQ